MKRTLTKNQAAARLEKLRALIERHRYNYHVLDRAEISAEALDSLKHELAQLEEQYPDLITPDSPSQRVAGKPLPQFRKVTHATRMFSLADAFSFEELQAWDERWRKIRHRPRGEYLVDLKLDGLALSLTYENGRLARAATRGDGFVGEDVTHTVRTIESVPLRLRIEGLPKTTGTRIQSGTFEVRGEAVMLKNDFERLNQAQLKSSKPLFANPRNVAAGSIRQLDPAVAANRKLTFYAWELVTDVGQSKLNQSYEIMKSLGFRINPRATVCQTLNDVQEFHRQILKERDRLPFWIDGVVVKLNDRALYRELGYVGKTPRAAIAWKYSAAQVTTIVEDIAVQVGRTGALTPVAHLKPVQVAGTTVARATLHNADEIGRLDVRIGDTVVIQKAGDIIPEVVRVLPELRPRETQPWRMASHCPVCRQPVRRRDGEAIHYCTNPHCPAKHREGLYHFVSRHAFDIVGLGPNTIDVLVEEGLVKEPSDFFRLTAEDLIGLPLFAEKKAENLVSAIQARRKVSFERFLFALGIRHVGEETARVLARQAGRFEILRRMSFDDISRAPDIGPIVGQSIVDFFSSPSQTRAIDALLRYVKIEPAKRSQTGPLDGLTLVVTGTLVALSREEAENRIRSAGGHAANSVSKKTSAVIVGADPGSKAERARELGVPIWNEQQFLRRLTEKR